ncbi:agamous-like MADS-box protein AGL29 [Solanum dulcamara]|uniref:agamous-like MADS-box protein AGL29 n=1 Tax=Solanum dulcamara TaxID=45834 RepID=UPI0024850064|nr:agamous-like MADS-box protein AGL29 [Solanum dulcamara]
MRRPNGRRRVDIVRMQNRMNLQVTFSKRRTGIFKKASELSTLCGAHVTLITYSPSNKVYSCGHPSVEFNIDRFLGVNPPPDSDAPNPIIVAHQNANVRELNRKLNNLESLLEKERKHGEALEALRTEPSHETLSFLDLKSLSEALEAAGEELERVASQNKECGIEYPYQTLGSAFAPLRVTESTSADSNEGPSESSRPCGAGSGNRAGVRDGIGDGACYISYIVAKIRGFPKYAKFVKDIMANKRSKLNLKWLRSFHHRFQ